MIGFLNGIDHTVLVVWGISCLVCSAVVFSIVFTKTSNRFWAAFHRTIYPFGGKDWSK